MEKVPHASPLGAAADPTPKVLLVDDQEQNVLLLADFLSETGWQLFKAYDGAQALRLMGIVRPDLVVLDINMPGMDGIEVCRRIKADPASASSAVLFVTALGDVQTHVQAIEAGGSGFITKPVDRAKLLAYAVRALETKQASDRAELALDNTKSALGMLVHDIRNLVQVSQTYLQLVLVSEGLPAEAREFTETALQIDGEISLMANSLLDLQREEAVGLRVDRRSVELREIVRPRVTYASASARGRQFVAELPDEALALQVETDPELLARMLDNLLLNAAKFCPKGGQIRASLRTEGGRFSFSVENDGPPIPADLQPKLFTRFGQANNPRPLGKRGVGLGLAFCKAAATALGGDIQLESPPPGRADGVRFHLWLPVA